MKIDEFCAAVNQFTQDSFGEATFNQLLGEATGLFERNHCSMFGSLLQIPFVLRIGYQ